MDSDDRVLKDPAPEEVYNAVRNGIITILQIVKWCDGDKDVFWNFLLDVGCVSAFETAKRKQGLPRAVARFTKQQKDLPAYYRVYGQVRNEFIATPTKQEVFNDFQTLTLVSKGVERPVEQSHLTVPHLTSGPTTYTLKQAVYAHVCQTHNAPPAQGARATVAGSTQVRMLLAELKSMSMA
jgi:hypothetical protein